MRATRNLKHRRKKGTRKMLPSTVWLQWGKEFTKKHNTNLAHLTKNPKDLFHIEAAINSYGSIFTLTELLTKDEKHHKEFFSRGTPSEQEVFDLLTLNMPMSSTERIAGYMENVISDKKLIEMPRHVSSEDGLLRLISLARLELSI
jgi:hypothetical protein